MDVITYGSHCLSIKGKRFSIESQHDFIKRVYLKFHMRLIFLTFCEYANDDLRLHGTYYSVCVAIAHFPYLYHRCVVIYVHHY